MKIKTSEDTPGIILDPENGYLKFRAVNARRYYFVLITDYEYVVILGMIARVAFQQGLFLEMGVTKLSDMDAEMGLPLLLRAHLPVGLMGIMLSVYFSAIMSTADSCLMASSGTLLSDILKLHNHMPVYFFQLLTLVIGALAIYIALKLPSVLDLMIHSYSVMVSGLFVPVMAALFFRRCSSVAALWSIVIGGGTTLFLILSNFDLPFQLNANVFGITASFITIIILSVFIPTKRSN